jgi:hypothetical protein
VERLSFCFEREITSIEPPTLDSDSSEWTGALDAYVKSDGFLNIKANPESSLMEGVDRHFEIFQIQEEHCVDKTKD